MTSVACASCGVEFEKETRYVTQAQKRGQGSFFCGRGCSAVVSNKGRDSGPASYAHLLKFQGNRRDEYTEFRFHFRNVQNRMKEKGLPLELTLDDLKAQWDKQQGICPFTGWTLLNPGMAKSGVTLPFVPYRASLDRIDSSKNYAPGNIQFVAMMANFAKNIWSGEEVIKFGLAIAATYAASLT